MCEHCVDCFFRDEEDGRELCFLDPDNPVEVNYSDPACEHFELSDSAAAEGHDDVMDFGYLAVGELVTPHYRKPRTSTVEKLRFCGIL